MLQRNGIKRQHGGESKDNDGDADDLFPVLAFLLVAVVVDVVVGFEKIQGPLGGVPPPKEGGTPNRAVSTNLRKGGHPRS